MNYELSDELKEIFSTYQLPKFVQDLHKRREKNEISECEFIVLLLENKRLSFEQRVSIVDVMKTARII